MGKNKNKNNAISRYYLISCIQMYVGGFFCFIFGIAAINSVVNWGTYVKTGAVIVSILLFTLFLCILIFGIIRQKFVDQYFSYMELLDQRRSYSIDQLAVILEVPPEDVRSNLKKMGEENFLEYVYIDDNTNRVINTRFREADQTYSDPEPERWEAVTSEPVTSEPETEEYEAEEFDIADDAEEIVSTPGRMIQVVCQNCGAPNKVDPNSAAECIYCGSIIN